MRNKWKEEASLIAREKEKDCRFALEAAQKDHALDEYPD